MKHHNHRESRIENPVIYVPIRHYICRESSTNQPLFMQNKPNVKYAKMNISPFMTIKYVNLDTWLSGKKQTQFKPKQTQSSKSQNECKLNFNKGLQKKR